MRELPQELRIRPALDVFGERLAFHEFKDEIAGAIERTAIPGARMLSGPVRYNNFGFFSLTTASGLLPAGLHGSPSSVTRKTAFTASICSDANQ